MLWNVLSRRMPALLMTMSTVPNASTAVLHDRLAALGGGHAVRVGDRLTAAALISSTTCSAGLLSPPSPVDRTAEVVDHDQRASLGQLERVLASEAAAGAGDDRNFAVEPDICHGAGH